MPKSDRGSKTVGGSSSESLEYKLAVINAGGYVSKTDVTVDRFRYLLEAIHQTTGLPKERIGDMTLAGRNILRENTART
jgi:hypothetical protein